MSPCSIRFEKNAMHVQQSHKRVPMGRAPYKFAKEGGGRSFECFSIYHERVPMSCLHALEANNWTNNNLCTTKPPAALKSSPDGTHHSERHMSPQAWCSLRCTNQLCPSTQRCPVATVSEVLHKLSYLRYAQHLRLCFSNSTKSLLQGGC